MAAWRRGWHRGRRLGEAGTEAHVRAPAIVVGYPYPQDLAEMSFVGRNQPVQTFAAHRPDQAFAEGVRLRRARRRLQDALAHCRHRVVDERCVDRIAIVDEPPVRRLTGYRGTELLHRPGGVGCSVTFQCMIRRVPTSNTTTT